MDINIKRYINRTGGDETFLSPQVHRLYKIGNGSDSEEMEIREISNSILPGLGGLDLEEEGDPSSLLNENKLINWEKIIDRLPESKDTYEYYYSALECLNPLLIEVKAYYRSVDSWQSYFEKFHSFWFWVNDVYVIERALKLLLLKEEITVQSNVETGPLHSTLMLTSLIEAGLRNVILSDHSSCPLLLKDMFCLLERVMPNQVKLMNILMGPPASLNLRNVTWHGFISPSELGSRYGLMLLCLINDIGFHLSQKNNVPLQRSNKLPKVIMDDKYLVCFDQLVNTFHSMSTILPSHSPMWDLSLKLHGEKRCGEALLVLLPQLEHLCRIVFAFLISAPNRVMTAEEAVGCVDILFFSVTPHYCPYKKETKLSHQNSTLYTTFDEILNSRLPTSDNNEPNPFPIFLGTSLTMCLMDLLVYPGGPRIRDRMSHGEVLLRDVSKNVSESILTVACCVVEKLMGEKMVTKLDNYESQYHPISITVKETQNFQTELTNLEKYLEENEFLTSEMISETWLSFSICPNSFKDLLSKGKIKQNFDFGTVGDDDVDRIIGNSKTSSISNSNKYNSNNNSNNNEFYNNIKLNDNNDCNINNKFNNDNYNDNNKCNNNNNKCNNNNNYNNKCNNNNNYNNKCNNNNNSKDNKRNNNNNEVQYNEFKLVYGEHSLNELNIPTLYRFENQRSIMRKEKEINHLLYKIISTCRENVKALKLSLGEFEGKRIDRCLRSRGRETYNRLLKCLPTLVCLFRLPYTQTCLYMKSLNDDDDDDDVTSDVRSILKHLNQLLTFQDNLKSTFTSNKWAELHEKSNSVVKMFNKM